jgi:hypothetical protein
MLVLIYKFKSKQRKTKMPEKVHDQIAEAYHSIDDIEQLAIKTGVGEEAPGQDGVAYASVTNEGSHYINRGLVTDDAAIAVEDDLISQNHKDWKRTDPTGPRYAKTYETTGTYDTSLQRDGKLYGDTVVKRADGKGSVYQATLKGENGEKAAVIIANRAARRVREAIVDRTVKLADELKQEDKN